MSFNYDRTDAVADLAAVPKSVKKGTPDFFNISRILQIQGGAKPTKKPGDEQFWGDDLMFSLRAQDQWMAWKAQTDPEPILS
jgi:hypothetical protein